MDMSKNHYNNNNHNNNNNNKLFSVRHAGKFRSVNFNTNNSLKLNLDSALYLACRWKNSDLLTR